MDKLFKREKYLKKIRSFYHDTDIIKVFTGIRRCGKSSLMSLVVDELLALGISNSNIIYINLDKREYRKINNEDQLENIIEDLSNGIKGTKYLFIDEIQNVSNFENVINGFREEGDFSIFITGSNSYLLSGELTTKLTGRYISFEIFTLTFDEYLEMKKFYNKSINSDLDIELANYANEGGFPRTIFYDNLEDKRNYITELVNEIFEKDIKKRVVVRKPHTLNLVRDYLINNYSATTSLDNILRELNKKGLQISKSTFLKYVQILIDAKLIYPCERFDMKSKKMLSGEKKYYIADISLSFVTNPNTRVNYGQLLENIFFLFIKSKGYGINVGKIGTLECDFIIKDCFLNYYYAQISYLMLHSIETENREYASLEKIKDNFPKYILTMDKMLQKRNGIIHNNILDFMINNKV